MDKKEESNMNNNIKLKKISLQIIGTIIGLLLLASGVYGYLYATTPDHIRNPEFEHYHLRTQIIVDGEPIDFSKIEFQEEYDKSCSDELPELPIDFHDGEDQITHIHWSGITGGELLKYYGWNLIGGMDDSLGRRHDQSMMGMHPVETKGDLLPEFPEDTNFYVYIGDENGYEQKDWGDFVNMDLEEFFGTKSKLNTSEKSSFNILDILSGQAYAHGGMVDDHPEGIDGEDEEARLTRLNNLIGNVVIFAQEDEPGENEIVERFNNLVPLHDSSCGG